MFHTLRVLPIVVSVLAAPLFADDARPDVDAAIARGVSFLKASQAADGSWTSPTAPGISAVATYALVTSVENPQDPAVQSALKHLLSHVKPDGGIYGENSSHQNYETSLAVLALQAADAEGTYRATIDNAVKFLKKLQWDDEEVGDSSHTSYGGAGYGRHQRPDLSNTQFFLEALRAAGVSSSDPAMQKALQFVSRCQNLEGEHNTTPFAAKINDGGFYYTAAAGGSSQAGSTPDGGLRSYASMTYAGLKSMIYAGVTPDDPRVVAAQNWIRRFYTLTENPGMGQNGLYYYYQTFAKTLDVLGSDTFVDADGASHDWRRDLAQQLTSVQKDNGSWINDVERWYEGDPNLVTAYALLALDRCRDQ